ncbi:MAG TPA: FAD-dependent oxidoreductase [Alphaproteobacteria bacterium]|jgi:NADH dehydrogenase|nr:FAD-dependent oxidoreductase [Alphaproteobacteria bacterium]
MNQKTRVVVLGAGFAGMFAAKHLRRLAPKDVEIELINEVNYFVFQPLLPEVAAGNINASDAVSPLRLLLPGVKFRRATVRAVFFRSNRIQVTDDTHRTLTYVPYDHLVLAPGQAADLSRFPGLAEHSFSMKTLADAYRLRNQAINCLERADVTDDPKLKRRLLTFVVVGAGFSGVETAGEMKDLIDQSLRFYPHVSKDEIRMILVEYAERILPELPDELAAYTARKLVGRGIETWLKTALKSASVHAVEMADGRVVETETVVATIGTAPHRLVRELGLPLQWGRIKVDGTMRVPGLDNVWAVGDAALIPLPKKPDGSERFAAPTAQFAVREAATLARNVLAAIAGRELKEFDYKPKGSLASIGCHKAVAVLLGVRLSGTTAWLVWRMFYLAMLPGLATKVRVMMNWLLDHFFPRSTVQIRIPTRDSARYVRFRKGDEVFQPGHLADGFYTVISGSFDATIGAGTPSPLHRVLGPGEHFGERVLFGDDLRTGAVVAIEDSETLFIERDDFRRIAAGFKILDEYFRNYLVTHFPEHMLPESLRPGGKRASGADQPKAPMM